ncbi:MAG TPA: right-handed parallel beta-helix repeat-containing protein [Pyrinomonadaceae bacterium]|nr:right-handed parallel beta-helix repeat-containing protein [Pyrinomonadaceae bacterium]
MFCFRRAALRLALVFAATVTFAAAAQALPQTFVSVSGNNANTCDRTAPCRTFAGALTKTDANGEIVVLDAGEYGTVSTTKSVRIIAEGVFAGIGPAAVPGVSVNGAGVVVLLKGLTITGKGNNYGVILSSGGPTVSVENCTITNFSRGIYASQGKLHVKDTVFRNNAIGISVNPGGGGEMSATIEHCQFENNNNAVSVLEPGQFPGSAKAVVRDSVASGSISYGFTVTGDGAQLTVEGSTVATSNFGLYAAAGGKLEVKHSTSANNVVGVYATDAGTRASVEGSGLYGNSNSGLLVTKGGEASVSDSAVSGNAIGLRNEVANPGTLKSFGNNRVEGNTTNVVGTLTPASQT